MADDHGVEARRHPWAVEVLYGGGVLCTMPLLEELFGSLTLRAGYDALGRTHGERADVEYVRLLRVAATTDERVVARGFASVATAAAPAATRSRLKVFSAQRRA